LRGHRHTQKLTSPNSVSASRLKHAYVGPDLGYERWLYRKLDPCFISRRPVPGHEAPGIRKINRPNSGIPNLYEK